MFDGVQRSKLSSLIGLYGVSYLQRLTGPMEEYHERVGWQWMKVTFNSPQTNDKTWIVGTFWDCIPFDSFDSFLVDKHLNFSEDDLLMLLEDT